MNLDQVELNAETTHVMTEKYVCHLQQALSQVCQDKQQQRNNLCQLVLLAGAFIEIHSHFDFAYTIEDNLQI